ncbi:MAG: metal-dependent hydrolase [bacterium]|nr:metal-dependent hydrolase [bacterium]
MLASTHVGVGVAVSLAILQPETIPGCAFAIVGGAFGGLLPDFDQNDEDVNKGIIGGIISFAVILAAVFCADYFIDLGFIQAIKSDVGLWSIAGAVVFVATTILGITQKHRTFTHSLLAIILWSGAAYIACKSISYAIAIGLATHVILDLLNKRGMTLFFPIKKRLCLNLCPSNGVANTVLNITGLIVSIALGAILVVRALADGGYGILTQSSLSEAAFLGLTKFQLYLIVVNTLAFIVNSILFLFCYKTSSVSRGVFITGDIVVLMAAAGGPLGMLLSLFVTNGLAHRKHPDVKIIRPGTYGNWMDFMIAVSLCIFWALVCIVSMNLFGLDEQWGINPDLSSHIPLIVAFLSINALTFLLFFLDRNNIRRKFGIKDAGLIFMSFIGGALGGLLGMGITNTKMGRLYFAYGLPVIMAMNIAAVAFIVFAGIA